MKSLLSIHTRRSQYLAIFALVLSFNSAATVDDQSSLDMTINAKTNTQMQYDWPILSVATGEYSDGPTGVTVFHFDKKVSVAIDARGGGPGTVNAEYMKLGYDIPELDTVVFAGGSWYGLEAVTAVASALKDDGLRDGNAFSLEPSVAMSVGAIIFDYGTRRLNEIYPDKRLAQATFREAKTGTFPLGATGAGRFAKTGGFFGCNAFSGQGGAFRQIGDIKIAAFTVVNSLGVIVDRDGVVQACYPSEHAPDSKLAKDLFSQFVNAKTPQRSAENGEQSSKNTTISLIVVNQKLEPALLQRLAVQVHTSMGRAIQPFATVFDGDVLYAVSTNELEEQVMQPHDLGVLASEVMWDALLSSTPAQPSHLTPSTHTSSIPQNIDGTYTFSRFAELQIKTENGKIFAKATGKRKVYAIGQEKWRELQPTESGLFTISSRYPLSFLFEPEKAKLTINPGHWEQVGHK